MRKPTQHHLNQEKFIQKLFAHYGINNAFTYQDAMKFIAFESIERFALTYCVKLGILRRPKKGIYIFTKSISGLKLAEMMHQYTIQRGRERMNNIKKNRLIEAKAMHEAERKNYQLVFKEPKELQGLLPAFEKPTPMTDEQMIDHLKSKGYKIMKPIQQYEEI